MADPVPQALILTAIVIGFGVIAFAMVLGYRAYQAVGTDDMDHMQSTDQIDSGDEALEPRVNEDAEAEAAGGGA